MEQALLRCRQKRAQDLAPRFRREGGISHHGHAYSPTLHAPRLLAVGAKLLAQHLLLDWQRRQGRRQRFLEDGKVF